MLPNRGGGGGERDAVPATTQPKNKHLACASPLLPSHPAGCLEKKLVGEERKAEPVPTSVL